MDLLVVEAGQLAEVAGEMHRVLVALAPEAAVAEELVDRLLEVERTLLSLGIFRRDLAQPVRPHLHVGDLVGEHPVLAEEQDGIVRAGAEVAHGVEHVDGEAFEGTVDAGEA